MADPTLTLLGGCAALLDGTYSHRIFDAFGAGCVRCVEDFVTWPKLAGGTGAAYLTTLTGAGTAVLVPNGAALGGRMIITNAAGIDDSVEMQANGSCFRPTFANRLYFGIKFQVSDATECDFIAGLCVPDTTLIDGLASDGIYFRKMDDTTTCNFVLEKTTVETETAALTVVAATDYILEFVWDGSAVKFYVDGVLTGTPVLTNIPTAVYLTPSIAFQNGEAVAKTMTVDWMRAFSLPVTGG